MVAFEVSWVVFLGLSALGGGRQHGGLTTVED